jgi:hypothetical protein
MSKENYHKQQGYQQGFTDGKRTGGKVNKKYVANLLKIETQHLSNEELLDYKLGWQEGFTDAVNGVIKSMVLKEDCSIDHLDELKMKDLPYILSNS